MRAVCRTLDWKRGIKNINQFQHFDKFKYLHLGIRASIDYRGFQTVGILHIFAIISP